MGWILWLILGLVAGVAALFAIYRTIPREPSGLVAALVIGLAGGAIGGWIADVIGLDAVNWIGSLVVAFVGAVLILWLLRRATGQRI